MKGFKECGCRGGTINCTVEGSGKMTICLEHRPQEERGDTGIKIVKQASIHTGPKVGL